jgi:hypothetical protein
MRIGPSLPQVLDYEIRRWEFRPMLPPELPAFKNLSPAAVSAGPSFPDDIRLAVAHTDPESAVQ